MFVAWDLKLITKVTIVLIFPIVEEFNCDFFFIENSIVILLLRGVSYVSKRHFPVCSIFTFLFASFDNSKTWRWLFDYFARRYIHQDHDRVEENEVCGIEYCSDGSGRAKNQEPRWSSIERCFDSPIDKRTVKKNDLDILRYAMSLRDRLSRFIGEVFAACRICLQQQFPIFSWHGSVRVLRR